MSAWRRLLLLLLLIACPGCIGPAGVRLTRPHYNETVQRTNEQELLLNLVRLRYDDSPLFVKVNAITAQFSGDSRAGVSAEGITDVGIRYFGFGDVGFSDRPTISYAPQQGADAAQTLLTPLTLESIALLSDPTGTSTACFGLR